MVRALQRRNAQHAATAQSRALATDVGVATQDTQDADTALLARSIFFTNKTVEHCIELPAAGFRALDCRPKGMGSIEWGHPWRGSPRSAMKVTAA
jgi:hypothetical protein